MVAGGFAFSFDSNSAGPKNAHLPCGVSPQVGLLWLKRTFPRMNGSPFTFRRRGMLVVLSAPSGGGKSIVLQKLLAVEPRTTYSVSVTSRQPRGTEVDGQDYHFVSRDKFESLIRDDVFYEYAEVHGNLYGTREDTVKAALDQGQDVLMDIDVKGGISVKWRSPDAILIFLMPPSEDILEQRLRARGTDPEAQIQLRLSNAREELNHWRLYDYVVINRDLDETVAAVQGIIRAERQRVRRLLMQGE
jgi:guanylate kinase